MSVKLSPPIENRFLLAGTQLSTLIALSEENIPFTQRGQGSQRLLSMGLHFKAWNNDGILLIDEIELGLEPSRIRSLINQLKDITEGKSTQIIITTHSPITLSECSSNQIEVLRADKLGVLKSFNFGDCDDLLGIESLIRNQPVALLCRRVIICEGETEVGIVRAIDKFLSKQSIQMSYQGTEVISGRGDSTLNVASHLSNLGYKVCVLMDSDQKKLEDSKNELRKNKNIEIFDWEPGCAIEEQIFKDVSREVAEEILSLLLVDIDAINNICSNLKSENIPYKKEDKKIYLTGNYETIGSLAKKKKWFKKEKLGTLLGEVILESIDTLRTDGLLRKNIEKLITWVKQNDD